MENKYQLIKAVYDNFGLEGPKSLTTGLEQLGFENPNKLLEQLIRKHLINIEMFLLACENELTFFPDIFQLMAKFPETLRFNRQIYLNRSNPVYNDLFLQITELTPGNIMSLFSDYYGLNSNENAIHIITVCLESWFSKIDINQIDAQKMFCQFDKTIKMLIKFKEIVVFNDI